MFDFVGVGILVVLLIVFAVLSWRAWRANNRVVRWAGGVVCSLLTLIIALVTGAALYGFAQVNRSYNNPVADIKVAGTPEQLARGAKLANTCVGCHSSNGQLPLTGQNFGEGGPPVGTLYAANLTPAGELKDWTDGEIIRAIREGIHKDGRSLLIMPSSVFHSLSDEDVQALVAYLRSQPAAEPGSPPTRINTIGALLVTISGGAFLTAQPPITAPVTRPPEGPTAEYGGYLISSVAGCRDCHGANLAGGIPDSNGPPAGPNLTSVGQRWSEADFIKAMRTGVKPDGKAFNEDMPWKEINGFASDDDLKAMYAHLKTLTPISSPAQQ